MNVKQMTREQLLSAIRQRNNPNAADELRRRDGRQTTIEITPTWTGIVPILLAAIKDGTEAGKKLAEIELYRMANTADLYVKVCEELTPVNLK